MICTIISKKVTIGKNVSIGHFCIIEDDVIIGGAKIDSNLYIRTSNVIHHFVSIVNNSILKSQSFLNREIPRYEIWFGNPSTL